MMQRYAVFSGSCQSLPAIQYLLQTSQLACVVLVDAEPNPDLVQLQQWLQHHQVTTLSYNKTEDSVLVAQLDRLAVNRGLIYLFRHIIRSPLLQYFNDGLVNIHPSPLPEYRGPQPLYWQIRNGETFTKLTLHKVSEEVDCGDIALDVDIEIHPFDTTHCLYQKTAQALPYLISQFCQLDQENKIEWRKQDQEGLKQAPALLQSDLFIDWYTTCASDIVNMARAGNFDSLCAYFQFRQSTFQLLQATKVDCSLKGVRPGTIVELDSSRGLIVKTHDGGVKLDIVGSSQGCFDGYRFALLFGLEPGQVIENINACDDA
ncbi:methionyl-tRNA formyltransferase [Motilimonas cestriensis]|uniref:methionyl-tRNA formyltransferase n=2 Tax=Motilimonas TaxID=1914248 RepID=UPI003DA51E60